MNGRKRTANDGTNRRKENHTQNRRSFLRSAAGAGITSLGGIGVFSQTTTAKSWTRVTVQEYTGYRTEYWLACDGKTMRPGRNTEGNDTQRNGQYQAHGYVAGYSDEWFIPPGAKLNQIEIAGRGSLDIEVDHATSLPGEKRDVTVNGISGAGGELMNYSVETTHRKTKGGFANEILGDNAGAYYIRGTVGKGIDRYTVTGGTDRADILPKGGAIRITFVSV